MLGSGSAPIPGGVGWRCTGAVSIRRLIMDTICFIEDAGYSNTVVLRRTAWGGTDVVSFLNGM